MGRRMGVLAVVVASPLVAACVASDGIDADAPLTADGEGAEAHVADPDSGDRARRRGLTAEIFGDFTEDTPGCVVAIRSPAGNDVMLFGLADLDAGAVLDEDTIFDIGSVSKQITAGAVALLVLDGSVDLDDDIVDWIDVGPYGDVVTIGDLVHHTSGLPDYTEQLDADDDEITTMQDAIDVMTDGADDDPTFTPGTEFEYSNTNYVLLSAIVEAASGQSLVAFATERIFTPLGMDRSGFRDDQGELLADQAQGYAEGNDEWEPVGSSWRQTGDGAVHAPATDLLRWAEPFIEATETSGDIGSPEWVELMLQPGRVADEGTDYAFGLTIDGDTLTHGGSWIGYSSALTVRPGDGVAVAVTCNIDGLDAESLGARVVDIWV